MGIQIEPRFFHIAIDYGNFILFDKLLDEIDPSNLKNQKKMEILFRFHYPNSKYVSYFTIERYKKIIDTLKIDLNSTCYGYTPLTHLVNYYEGYTYGCRDSKHGKELIDYLLSRSDININKPDRERGFPVLQCYLMDVSSNSEFDKAFIERLKSLGANLNWCDKRGQNLLHRICNFDHYYSNRNTRLLKYLIFSTDIDFEKKDKDGNTPLDLAEKSIIDEEEAYQKAMREKSQYYTPTRDSVEKAIAIRDILKGRIKGGI